MKLIISGTNRSGSRSHQVALIVQKLYMNHGESVELLDLAKLPLQELAEQSYGKNTSAVWNDAIQKVNAAEGLIFVIPEYNGSFPGALKLFIDHWSYPESFEARPVCFIGLGGTFGGLRPVEHLQQVMNYRNAYVFPQRLFLFHIHKTLQDGLIQDQTTLNLLKQQVVGFQKFVRALKSEKLDAVSVIQSK